jgi:hypothetical protein
VRGDARAETTFHSRTSITRVVPWLVVSGSGDLAPPFPPADRCPVLFEAVMSALMLGCLPGAARSDTGRSPFISS